MGKQIDSDSFKNEIDKLIFCIQCIYLNVCKKWLMLNCDCYIAIRETILRRVETETLTRLKKLSIKRLQTPYLIYMFKQDLTLNNLQLLIFHETKPNKIY